MTLRLALRSRLSMSWQSVAVASVVDHTMQVGSIGREDELFRLQLASTHRRRTIEHGRASRNWLQLVVAAEVSPVAVYRGGIPPRLVEDVVRPGGATLGVRWRVAAAAEVPTAPRQLRALGTATRQQGDADGGAHDDDRDPDGQPQPQELRREHADDKGRYERYFFKQCFSTRDSPGTDTHRGALSNATSGISRPGLTYPLSHASCCFRQSVRFTIPVQAAHSHSATAMGSRRCFLPSSLPS